MDESKIPILVGCGQVTDTQADLSCAPSPMDLIAQAGRQAAFDTGTGDRVLGGLDTVVVIRSFSDTSWRFACPFGKYSNPPLSLAKRLNADNATQLIYTYSGGNMPQWCVNRLFEKITRGEIKTAMVAGGEALATQKSAQRQGVHLDWDEDLGGAFEQWGVSTRAWSDMEDRHGMSSAICAYPLIENGIRGYLKRSIGMHSLEMGKIFSKFSHVASKNSLADRQKIFTAEQISTVDINNPYIGFPYTKLMNANAYINQSAAIILTSVANAKLLGIPNEKWVYLHGCADATDHWYLSDRKNFHSSPAISVVARESFEMAKCSIDDIDFLDLYSCFPSAVEIACDEIGLSTTEDRVLTVTGGLPYFGGPGNNYVTHSIAEIMNRVRSKPGSKGLVTANGNFITKHSAGIYSTEPIDNPFSPKNPNLYQSEIDSDRGPLISEFPVGRGRVETYTVMHGRDGPIFGVLYGRLNDGRRFIANPPNDSDLLADMTNKDYLNIIGRVSSVDGKNLFMPD